MDFLLDSISVKQCVNDEQTPYRLQSLMLWENTVLEFPLSENDLPLLGHHVTMCTEIQPLLLRGDFYSRIVQALVAQGQIFLIVNIAFYLNLRVEGSALSQNAWNIALTFSARFLESS